MKWDVTKEILYILYDMIEKLIITIFLKGFFNGKKLKLIYVLNILCLQYGTTTESKEKKKVIIHVRN